MRRKQYGVRRYIATKCSVAPLTPYFVLRTQTLCSASPEPRIVGCGYACAVRLKLVLSVAIRSAYFSTGQASNHSRYWRHIHSTALGGPQPPAS